MVNMQNQLALANPADFGTIRWAAEKIGCSERWVRDMIKAGTLQPAQPRMALNESGRRHGLVFVAEVETYAAAYKLTHRGRATAPSGKPATTSA